MSSTTGRPICRGPSTRPISIRFEDLARRGNAARPVEARDRRVVDGYIGEGVGELYVKKHFPPRPRRRWTSLIANLRAGLKSRLESSAWMDAATRAEALEKLEAFEARIGYPGEMARLFGSRDRARQALRERHGGAAVRVESPGAGSRSRSIAANGP